MLFFCLLVLKLPSLALTVEKENTGCMSMSCHFLSNQQLQGVGGAMVTLCHALSLSSSFVSEIEESS